MLPNEVLLTFVLVLGIIGAIYYVAILRPEQEEQGALRRRLKTGVTAVKAVGAGLRRQESPLSSIPAVNQILGSSAAVSGPLRRTLSFLFLLRNVARNSQHAGSTAFNYERRIINSRVTQLSGAGKIAHLVSL